MSRPPAEDPHAAAVGEISTSDPRGVLAAFDRAIAHEDAVALATLFTQDAQLLFANREPIVGRAAIRGAWATIFERAVTTDWMAETPILDVHGDRAYAYSVYEETVAPRSGGVPKRLSGRAAYFLRRAGDGVWGIWLALNAPARPPQEVNTHDSTQREQRA